MLCECFRFLIAFAALSFSAALLAASPQQPVDIAVSVQSRTTVTDAYVSLTAPDRPWWHPSAEAITPFGKTIFHVPPGTYRAFVGATGCQDIYREVRVVPSTRELRFDLEPELLVSGTVVDDAGQPILRAQVTQARLIAPPRQGSFSELARRYFASRWSTRTDSQGRWTIAANGNGSLPALIEAPGYAPAMTWLALDRNNQRTALKQGASLRVTFDRVDPDMVVTLLRDSASGADVPAEWQTSLWARAADAKTIEWPSLPAGSYHVVGRYPDPLRFSHAASIAAVVLSEGQRTDSSVTLPPAPRLIAEVVRLFVADKTTSEMVTAAARTNGPTGADDVLLSAQATSGGVVLHLNTKASPSDVVVTTPTLVIAPSDSTVTAGADSALQTFMSDRADASLTVTLSDAAPQLPRWAIARFHGCAHDDERFIYPAEVARDGVVKLPYPITCRAAVIDAAPYEPLFLQAKLQPKESKSLGTFALRPGSIADVHAVRDPGGQPAARAVVRVIVPGLPTGPQPVILASGTADQDGKLRLRGLPGGRELLFEARDPAEELVGSKTVTLEPAAVTSIDPLPIPLPARVTIVARIAPEFRERFPDAKILQVLLDRDDDVDDRSRRSGPLDKNDEIVFERVRPGEWHPIALVQAAGLPQPVPLGDDVDLRPGDDRRMEVEVRPAVFTGMITSGGKGIRAMIGFREQRGAIGITRSAASDESGLFTIMLPRAGVYSVKATRRSDESTAALGELQLDEHQPLQLAFPDAMMVVRVKESNRAVANAKVTATLRRSSMNGGILEIANSRQTDAAGEVTFDPLLAGRWIIEAHHPDGGRNAQTAIDLGSGDSTAVELQLTPSAVVAGYVHDSAGDPVPGAGIDCIFLATGNLPQNARADADGEGHFHVELTSPPPSRVNCGVTTRGGAIATFVTGPTTSADFKLPPDTGALAIPDWGRKPKPHLYWLVTDDGRVFDLWWAAIKLDRLSGPLYLPRIPAGSWKIVRAGTLDEWLRLVTAGGNALSPLAAFRVENSRAETVNLNASDNNSKGGS